MAASHRLAASDLAIWETVELLIAATKSQVHMALSPSPWESHTQERLTYLHNDLHLISASRKHQNDNLVYFTNPKKDKAHSPREHLITINDVRVRIMRACHTYGFTLSYWKTSVELAQLLQAFQLIPDSCCLITRMHQGEVRRSLLFLELENTSRDTRLLATKLTKYQQLYRSDRMNNSLVLSRGRR